MERGPSIWQTVPLIDDELKRHHAGMMSFSLIAAELSKFCGQKVSRMAIAGRIFRLKLCRPKTDKPKKQLPTNPPWKRQFESSRQFSERMLRARMAANGQTIAAAVPPQPAEFLSISLWDLAPSQCRYPQGEGQDIRFCGQTSRENSSYCEFHHRRCHIRN